MSKRTKKVLISRKNLIILIVVSICGGLLVIARASGYLIAIGKIVVAYYALKFGYHMFKRRRRRRKIKKEEEK